MGYNFILCNADTDSIMVSKPDGSPFTDEERISLLAELNSLYPPKIKWADDGYFSKVIIFKAKNYVLYDGKKIKYKGSAVKANAKEPALKEFIQDTIKCILNGQDNYVEIYHKYVKECINITDIKRWASRKTLTDKTYSSERANETKIIQAIKGTEYVNGNRIWVYFDTEGNLKLAEHFDGNYDKITMLKKLHTTTKLFDTVLDTKKLYINYSLKRSLKALEELNG